MSEMDRILRHVYSEPRSRAFIEWQSEYGLSKQLVEQVGRSAMEHYARTGQHLEPDKTIELIRYEEPDWDWWEPTSEWRRRQARDRQAGFKVNA